MTDGAQMREAFAKRNSRSRIAAMIFSWPPQFGQCSKSISNTRFEQLGPAQPNRTVVRTGRLALGRRCGLRARFSDELLRRSVERKKIAGTSVPVFGVAKTVADLFRYRRTVGDALPIEGLRQALRRRKATPAEIAREAEAAGVWATMEPYLMALTSDA